QLPLARRRHEPPRRQAGLGQRGRRQRQQVRLRRQERRQGHGRRRRRHRQQVEQGRRDEEELRRRRRGQRLEVQQEGQLQGLVQGQEGGAGRGRLGISALNHSNPIG